MAGQQTYGFNLKFSSDTKQIKQDLASLKTQLNNLTQNVDITKNLTQGTRTAIQNVNTLKVALENATNVDTGQLDFSKFNQSLKSAGLNISTLRRSMQTLGPEGTQAFGSLARSALALEAPVQRTNMMLGSLFRTLKSTAKWQISSSILQGFTGAIRDAFTYAQDLNKAMTDIKIVSDMSGKSLEHFAKTANESAKKLSTSTKEYANASLIFFQQGLDEDEVIKRTDAVIKMSQVTGEAVADVSSYMTAIWNNFAEGTTNLERYADIITALGAATASSAEEIAGGLEKFAAIAETVGLSYEYATTAIATVVAQTRQSEETVGTSFKTIFGRLQSLSLGESLEDGTNLTKYSNALMTVGVNIMDANGELKNMDTILDEVGAKWGQLSSAEKTGLAYTVAGTRQYTNFMALMDSFQGDFQKNLEIARSSEGELNKQADEYAESWEAAKTRVQASIESIYSTLLKDDFFIDMNNFLAGFLDGLNVIMKGMGGLAGILPTIAQLLLRAFGPQISAELQNMAYGLQTFFGITEKNANKTRSELVGNYVEMLKRDAPKNAQGGYASSADENRIKNTEKLVTLEEKLLNKSNQLSESEKKILSLSMQDLEAQQNKVYMLEQQQEKLQSSYNTSKQSMLSQLNEVKSVKGIGARDLNRMKGQGKRAIEAVDTASQLSVLSGTQDEIAAQKQQNSVIIDQIDKMGFGKGITQYTNELKKANIETDDYNNALKNLKTSLQEKLSVLEKLGIDTSEYKNVLEQLETNTKDVSMANKNLKVSFQETEGSINRAGNSLRNWADNTVSVATGIMSISGAFQQLRGVVDIMNDDTMSGWEKFFALLTATSGATMNLIFGLKDIGTLIGDVGNRRKQQNLEEAASEEIQAAAQEHSNQKSREAKAAAEIEVSADTKTATSNIAEAGTEVGSKGGNVGTPTKTPKKTKVPKAGKTAGGKSAISGLGKLGLVAAGIAVAVGTVAAIVYQYNTAEREAKEAAERAEQLKTVYEDTKNAYNDLKSSVNNYQGLRDGMDDLIRGTQEWKEKLIEANEEARKIIETGNLKLNEHYKIVAGEIIINEEGLKAAQENQLNEMMQAQATSMYADHQAEVAQLKADRVQLGRELKSGYDNGSENGSAVIAGAGGAASGLLIGSAIGSVIPGLGTAIGAAVGAGLGLAANAIGMAISGDNSKEEQEAIDKISDAFNTMSESEKEKALSNKEAFSDFLQKKVGLDDTELIDSLWNNKDTLEKVINSENELRRANIELTNTIRRADPNYLAKYGGVNKDEDVAYVASTLTAESTGMDSETFKSYVAAEKEKYDKLAWGSDDELANYVRDLTNGDYIVEDTGGGDVTLKKKTADGNYEVVGEENDINKSDLFSTYLMSYLQNSGEYAKLTEAEREAKIKEAEAAKAELVSFGVDSSLITSALSDWADDKTISADTLVNLTRAEVEKLKQQAQSSNSAIGQALSTALEGYDKAVAERNQKDLQDWAENSASRHKNEVNRMQDESGLGEEGYETYISGLALYNDALKDNEVLAQKVANRNLQMSSGLKDLNKTLKDNMSILKSSNKESAEYIKATAVVSKSLGQVFGVSFDSQWISNNMEDIIKAAEGDLSSLQKIMQQAAVETANNIDYANEKDRELLTKTITGELDTTNLSAGASLLEAGVSQTSIDAINAQLAAGKLTSNDVNDYFKNLGFSLELNETGTEIDLSKTKFLGVEGFTEGLEEIIADVTLEFKLEPYINQINQLEKAFKKLADAKKQAFGREYLDIIGEELVSLEQLKQADLDAAKIAEKDEITAKEKFDEHLKAAGFTDEEILGIKNGQLTPEQYEKLFATDETGFLTIEQEEAKKAYQVWQQAYSTKEKYLESAEEREKQQLDARWEGLEYLIDLRVQVNEKDLKRLETELSLIGEGKDNNEARMLNIDARFRNNKKTIDDETENLRQIVTRDLQENGHSDISFEEFMGKSAEEQNSLVTNKTRDALEQYNDKWYESLKNNKEILQEYYDMLTDTYDEINNKIEKGLSAFEDITSTIDSYKNIIDLIDDEDLKKDNELFTSIYQTQEKNAVNNIKALQEQIKGLNSASEDAQRALEQALNAHDTEQIQYWEAEKEKLDNALKEANSALLSNWEDALEMARKIFEEKMALLIDNLNEELYGLFGSASELQEAYSQQQTIQDQWLAEYEQIHELSKLTRQITTELNKTTSLGAKNKLLQIQAEVNKYTAEGVKMSQYDLDILQKRYDLQLAQIALEEAQNAKTQVRLVQDADGLSYVYTANQEALSQAEQDYEDKLYALEQVTHERVESISNSWLTAEQNMLSAFQEIWASDEDEAVKQEKLLRTYEFYKDQFSFLADEMNKITINNPEFNWEDTILGNQLNGQTLSQRFEQLKELLGTPGGNSGLFADIANIEGEYVDFVQTVSDLYTGEGGLTNYFTNGVNDLNSLSDQSFGDTQKAADELTNTYGDLTIKIQDFQTKVISQWEYLKTLGQDVNTVYSNLYTDLGNIEWGELDLTYDKAVLQAAISEVVTDVSSGVVKDFITSMASEVTDIINNYRSAEPGDTNTTYITIGDISIPSDDTRFATLIDELYLYVSQYKGNIE